jgi:rubrerythrin
MDKTVNQTFSSVISINPYKNTYFKGEANRLSQIDEPAFSKDQYAIAFLNTKSFITAMVDISKNIPEEDVYDALEDKIYEELALDMAVEYQIHHIEAAHTDENNKFYHVFVVDPADMQEEFSEAVEKIKYIDQIVPVPLLLKSLYSREIIDDDGVHCFLYFQENDSFFTVYNEHEFVYTKSLKFSFKQMHERFCELLGEQINYSVFVDLLSEEGLSVTNTEYQKHLIKLFGEIFLHINDVLTYAKRIYDFERIDKVFIGSQIGSISGLDEYSQTYLGLDSTAFDFDYGFESETWYVDQIHALMQLYTQQLPEERYECNFTTYHRPPPFLQRKSGQVIALTAASLVVAMAYPVTFWTMTYAEEVHKQLLTEEYNEVHNVKTTREATIKLKLANKDRAQKLLDNEKKEFDSKKETLEKIHDVKVNYPMKATIMTDFTRDFNRYKVRLDGSSYNEANSQKAFTFKLSARKDKDITALLEYLTASKTKNFQFLLETIEYNEDNYRYTAEMKAVLR